MLGGVAPKFGSEKVSRYTGVSQLQLRVSRYTVQLRLSENLESGVSFCPVRGRVVLEGQDRGLQGLFKTLSQATALSRDNLLSLEAEYLMIGDLRALVERPHCMNELLLLAKLLAKTKSVKKRPAEIRGEFFGRNRRVNFSGDFLMDFSLEKTGG